MPDIVQQLRDSHERFIFQGGSAYANQLANTIEHLLKQDERYEKVRRLNVVQFRQIFITNMTDGTPFDDLVDSLPHV